MNYPRGFGPKVSEGHSISMSSGLTLYSKSTNTRYVLSAFKGYAKSNPSESMILSRVNGKEKEPIARAHEGDIYILSTSVYV